MEEKNNISNETYVSKSNYTWWGVQPFLMDKNIEELKIFLCDSLLNNDN